MLTGTMQKKVSSLRVMRSVAQRSLKRCQPCMRTLRNAEGSGGAVIRIRLQTSAVPRGPGSTLPLRTPGSRCLRKPREKLARCRSQHFIQISQSKRRLHTRCRVSNKLLRKILQGKLAKLPSPRMGLRAIQAQGLNCRRNQPKNAPRKTQSQPLRVATQALNPPASSTCATLRIMKHIPAARNGFEFSNHKSLGNRPRSVSCTTKMASDFHPNPCKKPPACKWLRIFKSPQALPRPKMGLDFQTAKSPPPITCHTPTPPNGAAFSNLISSSAPSATLE